MGNRYGTFDSRGAPGRPLNGKSAELDRMNHSSTRWDSSDDYFDRDNDLPEYYYD
jgi:hypothetical protein